ncbi:bf01130c-d5eb-4029-8525-0da1635b5cf8 [Thermothielavioides terrestris]|uniref:Bf01130c-d5eb-4029-8525-0da1635b5cf8 n=1 Tax=Thermothielavioides terrestris TaxID=2587410 RepID=A0A3S4ARS3_9PEZI|nr:bf01130c-d5eb-4029-8525-0da1635b5cf8 [Thermothielavioides terrestris]
MGSIGRPRQCNLTPHANAAYADWVALQSRLRTRDAVVVNGRDLTIADVVAVSLYKAKAGLTADPKDLQLVQDSVSFLERELASGHIIYGVNTGFGGSADTRTQHFERLQSAAIQHLNVGILLQADKTDAASAKAPVNGLLRSHALPNPIVKAAMLIRCNSLMRGHSGVRVSVIESVMKLLSLDMTPVVPLRGSISASGDLSTLSYIAGAIEGNPDIYVRTATEDGEPKILPASETLRLAGLEPVRLQAKEGLGITNGTAPSCAAACLAIYQANQLAILTQLLTAMGTEALDGTADNYHPFISSVRPHPGQAEVAHNIHSFLAHSKLSPPSTTPTANSRVGLAQDRYALRTAPQWIGPQLEDLQLATRQITIELNSTTDNPLIDAAHGRIHHGGNFQAHALTSAMEKTLLALQNLGRLLAAQSAELLNNATSRGLPPNLSCDDPSASFTCKGFDVNMAAYAAELAALARPVSAHVQVAEMGNQSVNSMALVAARAVLEAVEVLALMAATYVYVLCQALDLRCLRVEFGRAVNRVVGEVMRRCCFAGGLGNEEVGEAEVVDRVTAAILQRWDQLAHLDLPDRCATAVRESLGAVLDCLGDHGADMKRIREHQRQMAAALEVCYDDVRAAFIARPRTGEYISPASKVVYDFVRTDLKIPLNRGVEDHPPLLLRKAGADNGNAANGAAKLDDDVAARSRILGTMASEIYEALRRGELHDRIMRP